MLIYFMKKLVKRFRNVFMWI